MPQAFDQVFPVALAEIWDAAVDASDEVSHQIDRARGGYDAGFLKESLQGHPDQLRLPPPRGSRSPCQLLG
jgi:hypothetical protein